MLNINVVETVEVTWGNYDDITGLYEFKIEATRPVLALLWDLMEYHQGNEYKVARDAHRLKLEINFGDTAGKGHRETYISGLYEFMQTTYPAGHNPFKLANRW